MLCVNLLKERALALKMATFKHLITRTKKIPLKEKVMGMVKLFGTWCTGPTVKRGVGSTILWNWKIAPSEWNYGELHHL